jgi:hypothetical protein
MTVRARRALGERKKGPTVREETAGQCVGRNNL